MALSTGKILFKIPFDNGDFAKVYINPRENGLKERIKGFENSFKRRIDNLKLEKYSERFKDKEGVKVSASDLNFRSLINMSPEQLETVNAAVDTMAEIDDEINEELKKEIDDVFNSDVSSQLFKYVQPLDMCQTDEAGEEYEPYIVLALEALANEITLYQGKMSSATKKYTDKYKK